MILLVVVVDDCNYVDVCAAATAITSASVKSGDRDFNFDLSSCCNRISGSNFFLVGV